MLWMVAVCSAKLELSLKRARRHGIKYGVKLVRGAYLVQETQLAEERGYASPIWPNAQATHDNYHACMRKLLDNLDNAEFMVATHNEESIQLAIEEMARRGVDPESEGCFV
jgi:proline dehydrogenase